MPGLQNLAKNNNYELRHYSQPLKKHEKFERVIRPFEFCEKFGSAYDSYKYYNNYYLYPCQ